MKRTLLVLLLAVAALPACSDGPTDSDGPPLASLSISPAPLYLGVGDTMRLSAIGTKSDGTKTAPTPSYKSSDTGVATVSGDGLVRGVAVGTTQITAKSGGQTTVVTVNVLAGSGIRTFNVNSQSNCDAPNYHGARLVASSAHAQIYEDLNNPTGGFTDADYQSIIGELENTVYPTNIANFGTPTDLDGNGKFMVLYTRAVNDLTPAGAGFIYGGFFHPRDVFPRTAQPGFEACPGSNASEMFYMLVPDPTGVSNGHVRTKAYVRGSTVGTIAHEFQHLINTSRRLYVNNADDYEEVWLDEGLSHIAEELSFYAASGLGPRQNLGQAEIVASQTRLNAFNEFQIENFGRLDDYLKAPAQNSPYASDDDLATRGAAWSFLRYTADRRGGTDQTYWFALVNSTKSGLVNLQAVLGTDPVLWARDWAVANYTDDVVPVPAVFTHPSWKFRDLFANATFGGYHLQVQTLGAGTTSNSVQSGSAAYYKFGVAPAGTADVRIAPSGTVAGACTTVSLAVGGVQQLTLGSGLAL
ncbi:MAG TPA: Ig-like domain-containing protein, partial [Longimicrobium sp.]|nr:Ig-like domain-containing protein [Longimicrobium sp.]